MFAAHTKRRGIALCISAILTLVLVAAWICSVFVDFSHRWNNPGTGVMLRRIQFGQGRVAVVWGDFNCFPYWAQGTIGDKRERTSEWRKRLGLELDTLIDLSREDGCIDAPIWLPALFVAASTAVLARSPKKARMTRRRSVSETFALTLPTVITVAAWLVSLRYAIYISARDAVLELNAGRLELAWGECASDRSGNSGLNVEIESTLNGPYFDGPQFSVDGADGYIGAPLWLLFLIAIGIPLSAWRRFRALRTECLCPCGYNLTLNQSGICPECGSKISRPGQRATTANDTEETQNSEPRSD